MSVEEIAAGKPEVSEAGLAPDGSAETLTLHRRSLRALTGIRFFAAAYVVIFHSRMAQVMVEHGHPIAGNFLSGGYLAVPLFFILSGFILAYTYAGQIETAGDHRRFFEARFARIWPVYAASLVLCTVPSWRLPAIGPAIATLLMVQAWNPVDRGLAGTWNLVCWTLSCELLFYLCFPITQTWLETKRSGFQAFALAAVLALSVVTNSASQTLGSGAQGVFRFVPLPVAHLPEFFIGVGLGNLFLREVRRKGRQPLLPGKGAITYLSLAFTVGLLCRAPSLWTSLVVPAFALLIYGLAAETTAASRLLGSRLLVLGGGISYAMYLMQNVVKTWVVLAMDRLGLASSVGARLVVTMLLLLMISYALFKGVEDPVRKILRGMFARLEQRRSASATRGLGV